MNSVSWMIYAADVADSLSGVFSVAGVFGVVAVIGAAITYAVVDGSGFSWQDQEKIAAHSLRVRGACVKICKWAPVVTLGCWLVASVIPSKSTIYAIAASESIEGVAQSETGKKALRALDAWLDQQIAQGDK